MSECAVNHDEIYIYFRSSRSQMHSSISVVRSVKDVEISLVDCVRATLLLA